MTANARDPSAVDGGDGGDRKITGPGWLAASLPVQRISHLDGPRGALTGHPASSSGLHMGSVHMYTYCTCTPHTQTYKAGGRGFRVCEGLESGGHWSWGVRANQVP